MLPLIELSKMLEQSIENVIPALNKLGIKRQLDGSSRLTNDELKMIQESQEELEKILNPTLILSIEQEERLNQMIASIVENNDLLFIDTSSLLQPTSKIFLRRLHIILKQQNKQLIVPLRVFQEVKNKQQSRKEDLSKLAKTAERYLVRLQQDQLLLLVGDESFDEFADNVFNTQITRLRIKNTIALITNDISLGTDVLTLNQSKSVNGKPVSAFKVSFTGHLMRILSREQFEEKNKSTTVTPSYKVKKHNYIPKHEIFNKATILVEEHNQLLPLTNEVKVGSNVYTLTAKHLVLGKEIGSGGEGSVYLTNQPNMVAKIYKAASLSTVKYQKLKLMVDKKLKYDGICYPQELLFNDQKEFVGYLMPAAQGKELKNYLFIPKKVFEIRNPDLTRQDLVEITITILEKMKFLHDRNIVLGDINPFNILIESPSDIYFVDVDSYQIEGYPCPVGTDSFTAPEIQGKNFKTFLRTESHDLFAVATLIFSILFLGKSPYSQAGGESSAKNIQEMDFPYHLKGERAVNEPRGQWRFIWSNLPYYMKEPLYKTFQNGEDYADPKTRLSVDDWLDIMKRYRNDLQSGLLVRQDEIANDVFPNRFKMLGDKKDLKSCKICEKEYMHWQIESGICESCMYKGKEYRCQKCGKELIFTNFEKYVKGYAEPHKNCISCHEKNMEPWDTPNCIECGDIFTITYGNKAFYDEKGLNYPKRCKNCINQTKSQGTSTLVDEIEANEDSVLSKPLSMWDVVKNIFGGKV